MADRRTILRGLAALPLAAIPVTSATAPSPALAALVFEYEATGAQAGALLKMPEHRGVDADEVPGWPERARRLFDIEREMYDHRAESLADVVLVARFLQIPGVHEAWDVAADLGYNLAEDILRLHAAGVLHG